MTALFVILEDYSQASLQHQRDTTGFSRVESLSLRSRRKHKAWGASPRLIICFGLEPALAGESAMKAAVARYHGLENYPRQYLGLALQALCYRLLRRLKQVHKWMYS